MNKQQLFEILMGAARRANELMVLDRDFNYQLGIDFFKFSKHVHNCCDAARVVID